MTLSHQTSGHRSGAGAGKRFPVRLFSQQLAMLLDSGIPMLEALDALTEKERDPATTGVLQVLSRHLNEGHALSAAMAMQPDQFDPLVCAIVQASERTGQLIPALNEHSRYLAWQESLRAKLIAAATYPLLLLLVGGGVLGFLLVYVLPQFASVLDERRTDLPWASLVLIAWGRWAHAHPVLLGALCAMLITALYALGRSKTMRAHFFSAAWSWPWIGAALRTTALTRLYRTMGLLLNAGMPAVTAMQLCEAVLPKRLQDALTMARERVQEGERLSAAWDEQGLCTPIARRMILVGERSGQLARLFERCASFHDEEISQFSDLITKLISPALMLVLGVLIGGIVVLMYLPIFQMAEQFS